VLNKLQKLIIILLIGLNFSIHNCVGTITMAQKTGSFLAQDTKKNQITLKWEIIEGNTERLTEVINEFSAVLIPSYTQIETDFALKQPEKVASDWMLKSLAPLKEGIDEQQLKQEVRKVVEQFFAITDWRKHTNQYDQYIFVKAEYNGLLIGVLHFMISPKPSNVARAALFGVLPDWQSAGIEKFLMASLFKVRPEMIRIFLHSRDTNQQIIDLYKSWGFTEFEGKHAGWTDLEYHSDKSNFLQNL